MLILAVLLIRYLSYDLDEWRHFWQAETQRYDSPPIYMAYLTLFDLHVGHSPSRNVPGVAPTPAAPPS
jgi:hypothetical protein